MMRTATFGQEESAKAAEFHGRAASNAANAVLYRAHLKWPGPSLFFLNDTPNIEGETRGITTSIGSVRRMALLRRADYSPQQRFSAEPRT